MNTQDAFESLRATLHAAKAAGAHMANLPGERRRELLQRLAEALEDPATVATLMQANQQDVAAAAEQVQAGTLKQALANRLPLTASKLATLCEGLRQLARQADLIGEVQVRRLLDEGLELRRVSCPLGVVAVIFESRPDALVQIAGLCLRTGNAAVLKGGKEALRSNQALAQVIWRVLADVQLPRDLLVLIEDRAGVATLLAQKDAIDLVIARGSAAFVESIKQTSEITVLGHAEGLCHMYLHADADANMASRLSVDSKCTYPAACNAIETLLWHREAESAARSAVRSLLQAGVRLVGCPESRRLAPEIAAATPEDWSTEYGDLILSLRRVESLEQALEHIATYGSRHTETIVCQDPAAAARFVAGVDAACVFHNASSRFADGFRFGLGAEVGISTDKLHARGPVGTDGLTTYRWLLAGTGHCTADYGSGGRTYLHRDLPRSE